MTRGGALRRLGRFLEKCERRDDAGVELSDPRIEVTETEARATVTYHVGPNAEDIGEIALADATLDDESLTLTLDANLPTIPTDDRLDVTPTFLTIEDGALSVLLTVTADDVDTTSDTAGAAERDATATGTDRSERTDRDVPPFEDTELLADIYDSCETFAEMADVIEMDVTAETVRRYMIQHGIHEPNSYDTARTNAEETGNDTGTPSPAPDADAPTSEVVTDGMGLSESVTIDDIVDAVDAANTIHEVGRAIGVERMDAFELLQEFDLLECVMGKLSTEADREVDRDEILDRIRRAANAR
ncbi:hypothetical protein [Halarchaeum nitratireducens]|uniref:Uncharacterized protein n=1 Tax=Halarchaeum nitratireducens TaxID=489913 RepID=A0A830GEJ9_9EURY|nr:hypothetical protein [Halarchaeum nitratireducens]GGN20564.1 hypothetical protein GCM10009021_22090 [Halarchaeum nitratireducens]